MSDSFIVACVQNRASADPEASLDEATVLAREAHAQGARLICLPEFFGCLSVTDAGFEVGAHPEASHPGLARFQALATETGAWMLLGSLAVLDGGGRLRNRSLLLDPLGAVVARYDKIHMFDVDLAGGESYRESDTFEPGARAVVAATPWGLIGLTTCYDLRFAYLYRTLAQAGASFLTCPAAFTRKTGEAHWHVLLRARAIETGAWVFAPCQYGEHGKARTYGHSLIVSPWGEVVADAGDGPGLAIAPVDPARVAEARRMIPALRHDRCYEAAEPPWGQAEDRAVADRSDARESRAAQARDRATG